MKTVLAIAPHPDDAEFFAGGTLAKWAAQGDKIIILTVTNGDKGSLHHSSVELADLRLKEAQRSAALIPAEVHFLHFEDLELNVIPRDTLRQDLVGYIRRFKPQVVVVEDRMYYADNHPDHRRLASAASDALGCSGLPLVYRDQIEQGLQPWYVPEKYYYSEDPSLWNTAIDISETFEKKIACLAEHKSQVVFMVEGIINQAGIAGVMDHPFIVQAKQDPLEAMRLYMQREATLAGEKFNLPLAEAFRYERYHPLIEWLVNTPAE